MISFNYETDFILDKKEFINTWVSKAIKEEGCKEGDINFIFL